jgi:hypothetical protein
MVQVEGGGDGEVARSAGAMASQRLSEMRSSSPAVTLLAACRAVAVSAPRAISQQWVAGEMSGVRVATADGDELLNGACVHGPAGFD